MPHKIAGFSYIYNGTKFDIPFIESIESVLDVVDQFVLAVCASEDDTKERATALMNKWPSTIKLVDAGWVQHFTEISRLANWAAIQIDPAMDFIMQLQSDEVVHERSIEELRRLPERMLDEGKTGARWNYHHFLGGPDITFPFCYSELVRVVQRNKGWKVIGDGVQFAQAGDQINEDAVLTTNIEVFHYGKMKSPDKGFQKEVSFQNLFKDIGFPDPKMQQMKDTLGKDYCDYVYLFRDHVVNKTIHKFTGTHPSVMVNYIAAFKAAGYEQLVSAVENLEIQKDTL